ncbi:MULTISPECIES: hypothetical protein [unclassified Streptomyces]|uniref:Transcriptional regulator n=1 Tax=Streptomyces sp. NBC_00060 TaxID=2975636 RepID=A0AAU2HCP0_9ACTN
MAKHPLASLRESIGASHPSYARLLADTHEKLGYGHMAARREKVSRWESGRTVPELTAQLAIAHLHRVPAREVTRLGWPAWVESATEDTTGLLALPWTRAGATDALHEGSRLGSGAAPRRLALTGPFAHTFVEQWRATVADGGSVPARKERPPVLPSGPPSSPPTGAGSGLHAGTDSLNWARARVESLETMAGTVGPDILYPAARSDLSLLATVLSAADDRASDTELLSLAARTASLCAGLTIGLGDSVTAERYYLVAARTAAVAGQRELSAACLRGVAYSHLLKGESSEVVLLVDTALSVVSTRPSLSTSGKFPTLPFLPVEALVERPQYGWPKGGERYA